MKLLKFVATAVSCGRDALVVFDSGAEDDSCRATEKSLSCGPKTWRGAATACVDVIQFDEGVAFMKSRSIVSGIQPGWLAVVGGVFCLLLSLAALAQEARPCAEDAAKLCKGVQPGVGRIAQCMKEHENELSPACQENMREMRERARDFAKACRQDIRQNCGNVQRGGGRIVQCLRQHEDALSQECREHMPQAGRKR